MVKTRDEAFALLSEYTKTESLIKHAIGVEAAMSWYAKYFKYGVDEIERWAIAGLLHDFDYEKWPDPDNGAGHPYKGNEILSRLNYPEDIRTAIMGHANYTGVKRETRMAKTLFAVDELCGLIVASTLVRPDRSLFTITPKSIKKKLKDKRFAAGCNRDDIRQGAEELQIDLTEHVQNVITGMQAVAEDLGLAGG